MHLYRRHDPIDLGAFNDRPQAELEAKYGLPGTVKFCTNCVISNQRPNSTIEYRNTGDAKKTTIVFSEDGECDACKARRIKESIDWADRRRQLTELCDRFRRDDGGYDVLVPGSGGKDSFYTAHMLKYEFGMHPLTVTWAPHIYTPWGWQNQQAWIHAGFDNILVTPDGRVHRLLTRLAVENLFHPFQPFMIGQKALGPKMSALYNIPLVVYGENEAEYGNPIADNSSAQRDWSYFTAPDKSGIYLSGVSLQDLMESYGVESAALNPYLPADPQRLHEAETEVHYLGYYLRWHPQSCYYYAREHGGFQPSPERTPGTYSKYTSIDDKIDDFHFYTTFIKFGIGRASYEAAQEIRSGDIDRDEGVALVRRYDGEFPARFAEEIFRYLSVTETEFPDASKLFEPPTMDREYFDHLCDRFRSPHLWRYDNGSWSLRHTVWGEPTDR